MQKIFFATLFYLGFSLCANAQGGFAKLLKGDPNSSCFPAAGMHNDTLEAQMLKRFQDDRPKTTPTAVRILSSQWFVARNELTGIITRRELRVAFSYARKPNVCEWQEYIFAQNHDGEGFQGPVYISHPNGVHVLTCGCAL